ncbi:MAG: hypothetical protein JXB26_19600 [Candidatus Aminicenantes bacterium]|nr:hypothetical protein [Candidatus Aminicenantes bacterium]
MFFKKKAALAVGVFCVLSMCFQGCATLQQFGDALTNLQRLQFRLGGVNDFRLAGIVLSRKASVRDFSPMDGVRLVQAFQRRKFPAEFVLDILVINPNDGSGGSPRTVSTLTSLESRLLIDGHPTVTGNIDNPFEIPGTGQVYSLSIRMSLDLYGFFGDKGYEDVLRLALAIGGVNGNTARLSLDALPRVSTPLGPITYPRRIMIIDREFR